MSTTIRMPIEGVRVGHWTDPVALTGCTSVLFPPGTVGSAEVRGGAPASRELDVLDPQRTVARIDAAQLTGGSAYGLASAEGVMRYLEGLGQGVPTQGGVVPIVGTLGLFDLALGDGRVRPGAEQGQLAAQRASADFEVGQVGAGTGAFSSHFRGAAGRRPGGLRWAQRQHGGVVVGALVAVNAFGDVIPDSSPAAADPDFAGLEDALARGAEIGTERQHTTIGVVVTNAALTKAECLILAQGAHDGLARAIDPPHTRLDGDAFISAATGAVETGPGGVELVRWLSLLAVADAIRLRQRF